MKSRDLGVMEYFDEVALTPSRDGVLVVSGNRIAIRVDNGMLAISSDEKQASFSRAACPLRSIVVTRDEGYVSFAAIHWLHDTGVSLVHFDYRGMPLLATARNHVDLPKLRRAQALAASAPLGTAIARELLTRKIEGQAQVLAAMGRAELAERLSASAAELGGTADLARMLVIESTMATLYWREWRNVPLRFARRTTVPAFWQVVGSRQSNLSKAPYRAMSPGGSLLNYLYGLAAAEMTIALSAAGLDPARHIPRRPREPGKSHLRCARSGAAVG